METKNKTGEGVIIPDHDIKTARRLLNFEAAPPINPTLGEAGRFKDRRTKSSRMRSLCVAGILPVIALLLFSGCQSPNTMTMLPAQPVAQGPVSLAAGDVIKLSFPGTPEYNQSQKIRPDGKISLPLIGEVQAAGKKIGPFQAELSQLYQPQLQNSEVVVAIDAGAEPVYVSGAVNDSSRGDHGSRGIRGGIERSEKGSPHPGRERAAHNAHSRFESGAEGPDHDGVLSQAEGHDLRSGESVLKRQLMVERKRQVLHVNSSRKNARSWNFFLSTINSQRSTSVIQA